VLLFHCPDLSWSTLCLPGLVDLAAARISAAFNTFIWPLLGLIFLPWTTLMYLIVFPGGVVGWDWLWIGLSVAADVVSYGSSVYNRKQVPGYTGP